MHTHTKCLVVLSLLIIANLPVFSQIKFEKVFNHNYLRSDFVGVASGDIKFLDVDNDNDNDLLITGRPYGLYPITELHLNDGNGNFYKNPDVPFAQVQGSSFEILDYNNDGFEDVFLTGVEQVYDEDYNRSDIYTYKLYSNDGLGNFSEVLIPVLDTLGQGEAKLLDFDSDGVYEHLYTSCILDDWTYEYKLYSNFDSENAFEVESAIFESLSTLDGHLRVKFEDINNDNYSDFIVYKFGNNESGYILNYYINDGNQNFIEPIINPFSDISDLRELKFVNVNNDNYTDILYVQEDTINIFLNDTDESFFEYSELIFEINGDFVHEAYGIDDVDRIFCGNEDIDNDGDIDMIIKSGVFNQDSSGYYYFICLNNGLGSFTMNNEAVFNLSNKLVLEDIDEDGLVDVFSLGELGENGTKFYENLGNCQFYGSENNEFIGVNYSAVDFIDTDNDGDKDMIITGYISNSTEQRATFYYINDGEENFSQQITNVFENISSARFDVADINGNGFYDIILTGENNLNSTGSGYERNLVTKLYLNDENGSFYEDVSNSFETVSIGAVSFVDVNGDNDKDLFVFGENIEGQYCANLYLNDGIGNFTEDNYNDFEALVISSIAYADVDGDNDNDFFICGMDSTEQLLSILYINDGQGVFSESENVFPGVFYSSATFGDVDNDSDVDLIFIGAIDDDLTGLTKLFINDGYGNFTEGQSEVFAPIAAGDAKLVDVDNNGSLDLILSGVSDGDNYFVDTYMYLNDGYGNFSVIENDNLIDAGGTSIGVGDFNNDTFIDLYITGMEFETEMLYSNLYSNNGIGYFTNLLDNGLEGVLNFGAGIRVFDFDNDNLLDVFIAGDNQHNNPSATLFKNITQIIPVELVYDYATITPCSSNVSNDGRIKVGVQGGEPPYVYEWSFASQNSNVLSNLSVGQYSCTVTDNNSNTISQTFEIDTETYVSQFTEYISSCNTFTSAEIVDYYIYNEYIVAVWEVAVNETESETYTVFYNNTNLLVEGEYLLTLNFLCDQTKSEIATFSQLVHITQEMINVEKIDNLNISIYPNPASISIHLSIDNYSDFAKIVLINTSGQTVFALNQIENDNVLNVSNLKQGMYFVVLTKNDGSRIVRKVIRN